jgi:type II secretory pathway component PulF
MESRLTTELEQSAHRTAINLENAADKTTRNIVIALIGVMIVAIALGAGLLWLLK